MIWYYFPFPGRHDVWSPYMMVIFDLFLRPYIAYLKQKQRQSQRVKQEQEWVDLANAGDKSIIYYICNGSDFLFIQSIHTLEGHRYPSLKPFIYPILCCVFPWPILSVCTCDMGWLRSLVGLANQPCSLIPSPAFGELTLLTYLVMGAKAVLNI